MAFLLNLDIGTHYKDIKVRWNKQRHQALCFTSVKQCCNWVHFSLRLSLQRSPNIAPNKRQLLLGYRINTRTEKNIRTERNRKFRAHKNLAETPAKKKKKKFYDPDVLVKVAQKRFWNRKSLVPGFATVTLIFWRIK